MKVLKLFILDVSRENMLKLSLNSICILSMLACTPSTQETINKTPESSQNKKVIPFFNLGPKNDWRKLLDTKVKVNLEKAFEKEMIELGYL